MVADDSAVDAAENGDDAGTDDSREQGVDIGALADELEDHSYPTTTSELLEEYGDYEIEMPDGSETLEAVLGNIQEDDDEQEYESAEDVRQMIYNMVGSEAVGREGYSDRGGIASDSGTASEEGADDSDETDDEGESF
jgi:hypothetical protein